MKNFRLIIEQWPNVAELAADLGVKKGTVDLWKHRNKIPAEYWKAVTEAAKRRGIKGVNPDAMAELAEAAAA
ncbi:MAG: hypothetical protein V7727_02130 [Sneathiella sp.]